MNWNPEAQTLLQQEQYQQVALFYEQLIENEPEEPSHYWYLGLAYLLQGLEEEAQTTWLLVMSQGEEEDVQEWTKELIDILEKEAQRQEALENYQLAWLIRGHIREIIPESIDNILHLLKLSVCCDNYNPENLEDWQIITLLQSAPPNSVNSSLLLELLPPLLEFPSFSSVEFAKACISHIVDLEKLATTIKQLAVTMSYDRQEPKYAADLTKICLQLDPDNLELHDYLYCFTSMEQRYDDALELARDFYEKVRTPDLKLSGYYKILRVLLTSGAWLEIGETSQHYKKLMLNLIQSPPESLHGLVRESLPEVCPPLFYLEDKPKENRLLINQVCRIYENDVKTWLKPYPDYKVMPKITPNRTLNIGYIAHTLRKHSVGWLSRWLLQYHNHDQFKIYVYFVNDKSDEFTDIWFRQKADVWHSFQRAPQLIAKQIQEDEIDILVELDSFTNNITYQVMILKPAPVQVTWLGFDASGLPAIDYFIADPYVLPEDAQDYYQEKIWRLPQTYLAVDGFEIGSPTLRREHLEIPENAIVYYSVQTGQKRHPDTIRLQMKILASVPNSYFFIKGAGHQEKIENLFKNTAIEEGVSVDRLRFLEQDSNSETHRANLQIADVVLDTYPYNGATTTLEVLWMGIPLVTRVGEQFAARNSYTFMVNAGLTEGIAWTDEEYVQWGIRLGTDENLRQQVAWKLRKSRQTAPLWNAKRFTRDMEDAYRQMWANYCQSETDREQTSYILRIP